MSTPKVKFCGIKSRSDIEYVNELKPDYIGFVFAPRSKRHVDEAKAKELKAALDKGITAVGVFVDEDINTVSHLLNEGVIDIAQLHGTEDEEYIRALHKLTDKPLIKAFLIKNNEDSAKAEETEADYILLDSGRGEGRLLDRELLGNIKRPYFLAGGLDPENVREAYKSLQPFALDVSSGIETDGCKDYDKMKKFMEELGR